MEKSKLNWLPRLAFVAAVTVLLAGEAAQAAPPKPKSCPLMITSCGCVITHANTYVAVNDLTTTESNQTCIEIGASSAILNLKGFNVLGKNDGTGIGILIDQKANHVIVEGGDKAPPMVKAAGGMASVSEWNIGIEDDGDAAVIALFSQIGGTAEPSTPGNATGGVFLNGVKHSIVGVFNANLNGDYGVKLSNTTDVTLFNVSANGNTDTGIELNSSNGTSVGPGGTESNGRYGIRLHSSSNNTIHDANGNTKNADTGIRLDGGSNQNRIHSAGAPKNGKAGIVITLGSRGNTVTVTHNEDNGNPNSDMVDLNPNCDSNIWYNNVGKASQACIK